MLVTSFGLETSVGPGRNSTSSMIPSRDGRFPEHIAIASQDDAHSGPTTFAGGLVFLARSFRKRHGARRGADHLEQRDRERRLEDGDSGPWTLFAGSSRRPAVCDDGGAGGSTLGAGRRTRTGRRLCGQRAAPVSGALSEPQDGQSSLAAGGAAGHAARRLPLPLRQLCVELAGDGWQTCLCLLRLAGFVRVHDGRQAGLAEELLADADAAGFRRRHGARAARQHPAAGLRSGGGILPAGARQDDRQAALESGPGRAERLGAAARANARGAEADHRGGNQ